jgi:hypothetical protein
MAITSFSASSGRLIQWDDVTSEFIINPDGDNNQLLSLGYNNTRKSISQLSADHDGQRILSGRPDFAGNPDEFPFIVTKLNAVITQPTELKIYVDRDVTIVYKGQDSYRKDEMTDNGDGTHYIDVPYSVYDGYLYQEDYTERWYFPSDGPFDQDYPQSISFTDADTGRSDTYNDLITYRPEGLTLEYLSNLTVISEEQGFGSLGVDLSTGGLPLTIDGTVYAKGFGGHSVGYFEVDVSGRNYQQLTFIAGVDDSQVGFAPADIDVTVKFDGVVSDTFTVNYQNTYSRDIVMSGVSIVRFEYDTVNVNNSHIDFCDAKVFY